ncbi:MAG: DNA primase [Hyphomonadaceae bacterium]|nr:MAG: DNA primase [Hyphomonadaceae bacterium]
MRSMSKFDRAFLDQVLQRTSIIDVVGRKVTWDKRKSQPARGDMWACCPFHSEKSPSFHAVESKGQFHCFGCGEHGNAFDFVMKTQNIGFSEVVEQLAQTAGLEMPKLSRDSVEKAGKTTRIMAALAAARQLFEEALIKDEGKIARNYLQKRGIDSKHWPEFGIGVSPNSRNWLKDRLTAAGHLVEDLLDAGLLRAPEDGGAPYDLYRGRLMFAIEDGAGKTISFGARTLNDDVQPKYLNGPETSVFSKSYTLYRYKSARAKTKKSPLIIAEGYMDVIALELAGFAAVAPMGTALTADQLNLAWRAHPRPVLCFDGDEAGQRAAARAVDRALPLLGALRGLAIALLPKGQDPDDIIKSSGPAQIKQIIEAAQDFTKFLFDTEFAQEPLETAQAKAGLKSRLRARINEIKDLDLKSEVQIEIKNRLNHAFGRFPAPEASRDFGSPLQAQTRSRFGKFKEAVASDELKEIIKNNAGSQIGKKSKLSNPPRILCDLVAATILSPEILESGDEAFSKLEISDAALDEIRNAILNMHYASEVIDFSTLNTHLNNNNSTSAAKLLKVLQKSPFNPFVKKGVAVEIASQNWLNAMEKLQEKHALEIDAHLFTHMAEGDESEAFRKLEQLVHDRRNLNKESQD